MADIAMCENSSCPNRKDCYRAQCTPNPKYQSYAQFEYDPETGRCGDFIKYW